MTPEIRYIKSAGHITYTNEYVTYKEGVVWWPGNPIDGKQVMIDSSTRRNGEVGLGKTKTFYYLANDSDVKFTNTKDFLEFYKEK